MVENNWTKTVTRGGQNFFHYLRMINQVLNKVLSWSLIVWVAVTFGWFVSHTQAYDRYLGMQWLLAKCYLLFDSSSMQAITQADGFKLTLYSSQIANSQPMVVIASHLFVHLIHSIEIGMLVYGMTVITIAAWLHYLGKVQSQPRYISGSQLGTVNEVEKIIKKAGILATLKFGEQQIPIPSTAEKQHFLFHGTTGTGKSTAIKELLDYIRACGDKAIIYDKSCNLVREFYLQEHDHLLNPLDARGATWNLWRECHDKADFENLAAALIPMPANAQDPFWINAARTIFAAASYRMRDKPSVNKLLNYLLAANVDELQDLLRGTEAETLMSEKTEKTAISIKSVLATYLKSLCYVEEGDKPFSIREWISNDQGSDWLFISSLGEKHEALKPLITCWLDIAANALLGLPENNARRIWIILDEVASLQQLPYLTSALSEGRKFGACFVLGMQSYSQIARLYSERGAQEIVGLLNTIFIFRTPDAAAAKWAASSIGETTIEEVREGISYGANTMRDGVSVNRTEVTKPLISSAEIERIPDLICYAKLPGEYPIVKLDFIPKVRHAINQSFAAKENLAALEKQEQQMVSQASKEHKDSKNNDTTNNNQESKKNKGPRKNKSDQESKTQRSKSKARKNKQKAEQVQDKQVNDDALVDKDNNTVETQYY